MECLEQATYPAAFRQARLNPLAGEVTSV